MDTIDYYNKNAEAYCSKTIDTDMSKQYDMFLKHVNKNGRILDFGCGSGRDSKEFKKMGYEVYAIDGSEEMCKIAREYTGLDVKCMDFFDLNDYEFYDGIWACSSILHVKQSRYLEILKKMRDAIKNDGCMFISFSEGQNEEEYKADGRYFNNINTEKFIYLANEAELKVVESGTNLSNVKAHNAPTHNQVIWNSMVLKKK